MNKTKVFLAGDTANRLNWGCRATTLALKSMIMDTSDISYSLDFSKLAKSLNTINTTNNHSFSRRVLNKISNKVYNFTGITVEKRQKLNIHPTNIEEFDFFADQFQKRAFLPSIYDQIDNSDVVVINGEGGFLKSEKTFPALMSLFIGYVAKRCLKKPCIIINHTADIRHPEIKAIAQYVYPLFDDVAVREPFSFRAIKDLRKNKPVILAADAVFKYKPITNNSWAEVVSRPHYFSFYPFSVQNLDVSKPYICLGGSAALHPMRRKDHKPFPAFLKLCKALNDIYPVVLVAACAGDEDFMREVSKELNLPVLGTSMPTYQAVDVLGNAALYVGGRWHSCIKALTGGTPIVVFSSNTNYKSEGIVELMKLDHNPFDSYHIGEFVEDIVEQSEDYLKQGSSLRERLLRRVQELSDSADKNVRFLWT
ncbi:hypothetical protein Nos7524_1918 [Nostoc sp. PCC 7524]|uniref:polysaccharide pyruvyl transferase family protein n=1 Tax=Nostoc sp. (strain ATCC 29411 / PCC 7524) TaxID=28072 RepID=UPI00029F27D4|nr:polysaccharide pyruvyl transferase family protein [Nostoc sp. PCC 7524]AFY47777.1 hypothetical protein Nos7524_1918 [Nostoc sp. PCC 7524]